MVSKNKDFSREINIIQEIESLSLQQATVDTMDGKATITKIRKEFKMSYDGLFRYPDNGCLNLYIMESSYQVSSADFDNSFQTPFRELPCQHLFDIDTMHRGSIADKTNFAMFFFDTSNRQNLFHSKLESPKYDGIVPWAFNCVRVTVEMTRYDIVQYKQDDKSYIVIENIDSVSLENFKDDSYAIQKGIGFLCGYMPGGEHYIFSGDDFQYSRLSRESLKSIYYPVTSNPYSLSILHGQTEVAARYKKLLAPIPEQVISTLVNEIRNSEDLSVAILFLMEVSHMKSVVSMPGVFSVILESLANIIINPLQIRPKLITDRGLAEQIIEELNEVLERHTDSIDSEALHKIKRRLNALNHPINTERITNAMKLREPFDQLGIILSPLDEQAIDFRNDLLHGNILMHDGTARSSQEIDDHMLYISAKLYTLISKLILKRCYYSGYVINQAKFYNYQNAANEQEYFELI